MISSTLFSVFFQKTQRDHLPIQQNDGSLWNDIDYEHYINGLINNIVDTHPAGAAGVTGATGVAMLKKQLEKWDRNGNLKIVVDIYKDLYISIDILKQNFDILIPDPYIKNKEIFLYSKKWYTLNKLILDKYIIDLLIMDIQKDNSTEKILGLPPQNTGPIKYPLNIFAEHHSSLVNSKNLNIEEMLSLRIYTGAHIYPILNYVIRKQNLNNLNNNCMFLKLIKAFTSCFDKKYHINSDGQQFYKGLHSPSWSYTPRGNNFLKYNAALIIFLQKTFSQQNLVYPFLNNSNEPLYTLLFRGVSGPDCSDTSELYTLVNDLINKFSTTPDDTYLKFNQFTNSTSLFYMTALHFCSIDGINDNKVKTASKDRWNERGIMFVILPRGGQNRQLVGDIYNKCDPRAYTAFRYINNSYSYCSNGKIQNHNNGCKECVSDPRANIRYKIHNIWKWDVQDIRFFNYILPRIWVFMEEQNNYDFIDDVSKGTTSMYPVPLPHQHHIHTPVQSNTVHLGG